MAGVNEGEFQQSQIDKCSFQWDEKSQLYYHASTGFYHDPNAGWYYSSKDGLYYKFENGDYMLFGAAEDGHSDMSNDSHAVLNDSVQDDLTVSSHKDMAYSLFQGGDVETYEVGSASDEHTTDCIACQSHEFPPPPSEWLEDTLIDLFLSGHPKKGIDVASDMSVPSEADAGGAGSNDIYELEEGEWIPDDSHGIISPRESAFDEGTSWDEENWKAQYGQVIHTSEESVPSFPVVDLWDWSVATRTKKNGHRQVVRLIGRLVKRSTKLHPSVPSGGSLLKTAPICEVHLDLVRVTSGQVYKLKRPSGKYLASLSTYDSSNPTKDWGFAELKINVPIKKLPIIGEKLTSDLQGVGAQEGQLPEKVYALKRGESRVYRDRAAERRALHGGIGFGPGQKKSLEDVDTAPLSPVSSFPQEVGVDPLSMSFGAGSYARRILESMGWKEGETLGNSNKGLKEPLQAIGNKGNAGLGWDQCTRKCV